MEPTPVYRPPVPETSAPTFDDAVEAFDAIVSGLSTADQLRLLGAAAGFTLSLIGPGERQKARDELVELIDATSKDAVLSRCN
jgi:hypothetical protein